jgi:hypothetical protein
MWFVGPLSQFFRQTRTPDPIGWVFLGFLILFFGILPATTLVSGLLHARRGGTRVTASANGIRIQEQSAWKAGPEKLITAPEILDIDFSPSRSVVSSTRHGAGDEPLDPRTERLLTALSRLVPGGGITIKTQRGLTTFGQGLGDDEIRYLHSIVRRALIGSA